MIHYVGVCPHNYRKTRVCGRQDGYLTGASSNIFSVDAAGAELKWTPAELPLQLRVLDVLVRAARLRAETQSAVKRTQ